MNNDKKEFKAGIKKATRRDKKAKEKSKASELDKPSFAF